MGKITENRVVEILNRILSEPNVPESLNIFADSMCQLYHFDSVRSFIRGKGSDFFMNLHEAKYGKPIEIHEEKHGVDLDKSYYKKEGENPESAVGYLHRANYIHTYDYKSIEASLLQVGYLPLEGQVIDEIIVKCITSNEGVLGYFVFEKLDTNVRLTEEEALEIRMLCKVAGGRIESFEAIKQLRDEEIYKIYDDLTGLPLLNHFKSEIKDLLTSNRKYALLCFDIDKFKYINEIWSRDTGNDILIEIAGIIRNFITSDERCYRIADDKFAVLLECNSEEELQDKLNALNESYVRMQQTKFEDIKIAIISGVYIVQNNMSVNLMIDKANMARRSVKGSFENVVAIYNQNLENLSEREKELESKMAYALEHNEFIPFLQPKFDMLTGEICGAEALARWRTAERIVPPAEFIPVFEKNGFIAKLDFIIYEGVFRFIQASMEKGYKVYPISLNVSRGHIKNDNFITEFLALLDAYEVPYDLIELELTESIFMEDFELLSQFISNIRSKNLKVSIDDFGTAYSSLNLLKNIDVDIIKLDKSFIDDFGEQGVSSLDREIRNKDKIIIKNVLTMIKELKFKTIFEGIETAEQMEFLREIGCNYGQGYYFSRPIMLEDFEERYL